MSCVILVCSNLDKPGSDGVQERLMAQLMDQVAEEVWLVTGTDVNLVLVAYGGEVTLVNTGEPRDLTRCAPRWSGSGGRCGTCAPS